MSQIRRIQENLALLGSQDWRKYNDVFSVKSHKFKLSPPLSLADVEQFESSYNIQLPDDYRSFLLEVGSAGAGPYYGILPLLKAVDELVDDKQSAGYYLALSSPLHPEIAREWGWEKNLTEPYKNAYQGLLALSHEGCSYYTTLVVTGKYKGRLFRVDLDYEAPIIVSDENFLSWYERWLDVSL